MNDQLIEARQLIATARESLRRGDKRSARGLGGQAAQLGPGLEDVWLILAASEPDPNEALAFARKALELSPQSSRAHRAVEWASGRLSQAEAARDSEPASPRALPNQVEAITPLPDKNAYHTATAVPPREPGRSAWLLPALLTGGVCVLLGVMALFALTSPALASIVNSVSASAPTQENLWAPVDIAKPEVTPIDGGAVALQQAGTPTTVPTRVPPTALPTDPPTPIPTEAPAQAPEPAATETPGTMTMEIVADTPTSEYVPPTRVSVPPTPAISMKDGGRWIDVDLTNQMVYAYEGDVVVNSFVVSTGTWLTPTVTGKHKIYVKVRMQDMSGPGYHLRDVPYVMFFSGDYGLHGTYWHNNFGTPMSRGCVNLKIDDAAWLFDWASVGTVVNVHY